jgi:hypothetical protein
MTTTGKNRIMIYGPKTDGTYVVEFRTSEGDVLAISIPRTETAVIRALMGFGLTTAQAERVVAAVHSMKVVGVRITEAGRLAKMYCT